MTTSNDMGILNCDACGDPAVGEIEFSDGEVVVGCADCLFDIIADPKKPIEVVTDYAKL